MKIRWGIIGVGDVANKRVANAIKNDPQSDLIAVCRRDTKLLNEFADRHDVPKRFTDAEQLLSQPDVDAVYIATPVDLHCPLTIHAATARKHVLVEKPMALTVAECDRMVSACEDAGVRLGVAYYRRFYPVVARITELIRSNALGRVLSLTFVTGNPNNFPADDWRVVLGRGGGGPLMDIGSHRVDLMLHLLGEVSNVSGMKISSEHYQAEQVMTMIAGFRSGAHGVLQCYFGTPNAPDRLEVIGTGGRIVSEDLNSGGLTIYIEDQVIHEKHEPSENFNSPLITNFVESVQSGYDLVNSGVTGREVNAVLEAAYLSGNLKRNVDIGGGAG